MVAELRNEYLILRKSRGVTFVLFTGLDRTGILEYWMDFNISDQSELHFAISHGHHKSEDTVVLVHWQWVLLCTLEEATTSPQEPQKTQVNQAEV